MGTIYYATCTTCRQYIDLDKFRSWRGCLSEGDLDATTDDLNDYKNDDWLYRTMRLHLFLYLHNGHKIHILNEHDFSDKRHDNFAEQCQWPKQIKIAEKT